MALRQVIEHPKLEDIRVSLNLTRFEAIGILECLWHFTGRYTPAGDIGRFKDSQILAWIGWQREGNLIKALTDAGWLDASDEYRLVVHDWHEHADGMVHAELAKKNLLFTNGAWPKLNSAYLNSETRKRIKAEYEKKYGSPGLVLDSPRTIQNEDGTLPGQVPSSPLSSILSPPGASPAPSIDEHQEQAKPRVLAETFVFYWTRKGGRGRTAQSAIDIEPQFAEHLRRHPGNYDVILAEIESPGRDRNEWPGDLLKRFEGKPRKMPHSTGPIIDPVVEAEARRKREAEQLGVDGKAFRKAVKAAGLKAGGA